MTDKPVLNDQHPATPSKSSGWPAFIGIAAICFAVRIANPFNLVPAWPSTGISIAYLFVSSLLYAGVFQFALRNAFGQTPASPGSVITTALASMLLYYLLFDFGYAIWLRSGFGIRSLGHFERAWKLMASAIFSVILIRFNSSSFPKNWRMGLTIGGWISGYLAFIGFLEGISYVIANLSDVSLSEVWEIVIVRILILLGNLASFCWAIALGVLYYRDHINKVSYDSGHYVPLFYVAASLCVSLAVKVAFLVSGNFY